MTEKDIGFVSEMAIVLVARAVSGLGNGKKIVDRDVVFTCHRLCDLVITGKFLIRSGIDANLSAGVHGCGGCEYDLCAGESFGYHFHNDL